jgi:hypothetical protein
MAINWSGQNTGGTTAMQQYGAGGYGNTAGWGATTPTGMTQQWRPSGSGATGLSNIGGSQIGLSRPQMSPAPPVYPQMSSAYPTSKGGTPLYNRDVQQQEQDWINQNGGTQWQSGEGATVPYPQMHNGGGNTTVNGTTYNAQGQQLDSNGNVAYGDWGSNNNGGGGGGQPGQYNTSMNGPTSGPGVGLTPGAPGHQGSQQDYLDPVTGQIIYGNEQATGWQAPYPGMPGSGTGQTSGEGGAPPQYMGPNWQMPFNAQQYLGMNPQQQQTANNLMANTLQYNQGQQNAYQYEQDRAQSALQYAQQHGLNVAQFMAQQGISEQQLKMAQEAQQFNQEQAQAYTNMEYAGQRYQQGMGTRQQDWAEKQGLWGQQNWGAEFGLRQNQQGHQQGMDVKQFAEGQRQFDVGQGNWQNQFGEGQRQFNVGQQNWQSQFGEGQRQFNIGQGNWQSQFGEGQRQFNLGLDWQKDQFGQEMGFKEKQFGQQQFEFGAQLDFEKEKNKQQYGLAVDNFKLNEMIQTGELKLSQEEFAQKQFEFGQQMDFEQQKNAQQFGLAVSNQELDWLVQTGQLDLQQQQFGQQQYEFGAEMGQRSYEFDAQQRQQMAIEQARLAQAEKAANVAAVGRTLAPSAKWLRAT